MVAPEVIHRHSAAGDLGGRRGDEAGPGCRGERRWDVIASAILSKPRRSWWGAASRPLSAARFSGLVTDRAGCVEITAWAARHHAS